MKSVEQACDYLPANATVSVTCSPVKGIDATIELSDRISAAGHRAIPHIAARLVTSPAHTAQIAKWLKEGRYRTLFLVGGDAETPAGTYADAASFLRDLLEMDHGLSTIGVTSYPDGHALISDQLIQEALFTKQQLLAEAGIDGYASTQMCFDPETIERWLVRVRKDGFKMPIHLGIPGSISQTKLITMGARLGIGASLRYLKKNRSAVSRLVSPGGYDPNGLLEPLGPRFDELDVTGLHCFTFNQVESTRKWQQATLGM